MEILTDVDSRAAAFFGRNPDAAVTSLPLSPEELRLAGRFFGNRPARKIRIDGLEFPARFSLLILQESAAGSNLDLMTDLQRQGFSFPDGLLCAAISGERFLGRFDRTWSCRAGNVHAVIPLRPRLSLDQAGAAFSILGAAACVDAISLKIGAAAASGRSERQNTPRIKWVNDVYAGDRKVAGMLTRQSYQEPLIIEAFLGIGVNVLEDPRLPGNAFVPATGCLSNIYRDVSWAPGLFLAELAQRIDWWYVRLLDSGPAPLLDFYRRNCSFLNRRVRIFQDGFGFSGGGIRSRGLLARGKVEEINDDLSIKIAGTCAPISSGRMAFEKDCRALHTPGKEGADFSENP